MLALALTCFGSFFAPATHSTGSHLWVVHEIFSNADGTVQFVELHECCGASNEVNLANKSVTSDATGLVFTFTENITGDTANRYLLLGTSGFAALPGAPTPDHIVPDGFFDPSGDTLRWHIYPAAVLTFAPGELPMDGTSSLLQDGTTGINTPTNYAGQSGTISLGTPVPTQSVGALVFLAVASVLVGAFMLMRRRPGQALATER